MCAKLRVVRNDEPGEPIERYIMEVTKGTTDTLPYERLMIWYRKNKMYADEIKVISKGIDTLKKFYSNQQKQTLGKKINPSLKALSDKISRSTGLHDKKGNEMYLPEPLPKWIKRKEVAESKMKKKEAGATKSSTPGKKKKQTK